MIKKNIYCLVLFSVSCAVYTLQARDTHLEYVPAGVWPDEENQFEPRGTISAAACGLMVQPGLVSGSIPAVRTLWSSGRLFGEWELPIDNLISITAVLPAATIISNEVCLLLNGRFSFFLPDGEFIGQKSLMPQLADLRNIADMASMQEAGHILLLESTSNGTSVILHYYFPNGVVSSSTELAIPAGMGAVFLVELKGEVYIGLSDTAGLALFYRDGTAVEPAGEAGLDTPEELLTAVTDAINSLEYLNSSTSVLPVRDLVIVSNTFIISTGSALHECTEEGGLLKSLLQDDCVISGGHELYYTGVLPGGGIFSARDTCSYSVHDLSGGNREIRYWRTLVPEAQVVYDAVIDDAGTWWILFGTTPNVTVVSSMVHAVQITQTGDELARYAISDLSPPFSFIRRPEHPAAVVDRKQVYSFINTTGGHELVEWEHGLATNAASEVVGAADSSGRIYLATRDRETKASTRLVHVYKQDGELIEELHFKVSFMDVDSAGDVLALLIPEGFDTRHMKKFSIVRITADNSLSEQFTLRSPEQQYQPRAFFTHPSGMILVADKKGFTRFCPRGGIATGMPADLGIDMRPAKTGVVSVYDSTSHTLSLHGPPVKRKPVFWRHRKMVKLGRCLAEKPEKMYQKMKKLRVNQNVPLKMTITDKRILAEPLVLNVECGFKRLRYQGVHLESLTTAWGNQPAPAGTIECHGDFGGKISTASLKSLVVNGLFSGEVETWHDAIENIRIAGKCSNATVRARGDIHSIKSDGRMQRTLLRAGISPAGFSGHSGNIDLIRTTTSFSDCTFIAGAEEGSLPGWSGRENTDDEEFWGTIKVIVVDIIEEEERQEPQPALLTMERGRVGEAIGCTLVTHQPVQRLLLKLVDSRYIINGKLQ